MFDDEMLHRIVERYPPADEITPTEFEAYVADVLRAVGERSGLPFELGLHQTIIAHDGNYDFDAVATYEVLGMKHTLLIEAKRHRSPIKRELVQALHAKLQSVGAQKALLVAAGRFQSGAIRYALEHGVALATLSEGRFTLEVRSETTPPVLTREQAEDLGLPPLTAHASYRYAETGRIRGFGFSADFPDVLLDWLASDPGHKSSSRPRATSLGSAVVRAVTVQRADDHGGRLLDDVDARSPSPYEYRTDAKVRTSNPPRDRTRQARAPRQV